MLVLFMLGLFCSPQKQEQADAIRRPEALQALENAHRVIRNGEVRWTVTPVADGGRSLNYVTRFAANGDTIFENRGDDDGWTQFDPQTGKGTRRFPQLHLSNSDGYWWAQESGIGGRWYVDESEAEMAEFGTVHDVRMSGKTASSWPMQFGVGTKGLWGRADDPIIRYDTEKEGDYHVVKATTESGAKITWFISPTKGWNAERVTYESGRYFAESMTTLEEFSGAWLPVLTEYFEKGKLIESIAIQEVKINDPNGPRRFTLNDIGIQPGEAIAAKHDPAPAGKPRVWNGEAVSEWDDWMADLKSGKREWGARMKLLNSGKPYDSPYMTDGEREQLRVARATRLRFAETHKHEGLWTRYVRDFIARFKLDNEQTQKALLVLSECQQRAKQIVQKRRSDFEDAFNKLDEANSKKDDAESAKAKARLEELRKPIDAIFEGELVPRLDKLPTRAQRAAADAVAAPPKP